MLSSLKAVPFVLLLCCAGVPAQAQTADAPKPATAAQGTVPATVVALNSDGRPTTSPENRGTFAWIVVVAVFGATAFSLLTLRRSLLSNNWSLTEALSEPVELTATKADLVDTPAGGSPPKIEKMVASTSRFIAMFGLVAILMMYVGFGLVVLYDYASTSKAPKQDDLKPIIYFLVSGSTLFAPYAVNKIAKAIS